LNEFNFECIKRDGKWSVFGYNQAENLFMYQLYDAKNNEERLRLIEEEPKLEHRQALIRLSYCLRNAGNYTEALEILEYSTQIAEARNGLFFLGQIKQNIGITYVKQGEYSQAINYYNQTLEIARKRKKKTAVIALSLNNIGKMYARQGNFRLARFYELKALDYLTESEFAEAGTRVLLNSIYLGLGDGYFAEGNYEKALEYYKKDNEINYRYKGENSGDIQIRLGLVYEKQGKIDLALKHFW